MDGGNCGLRVLKDQINYPFLSKHHAKKLGRQCGRFLSVCWWASAFLKNLQQLWSRVCSSSLWQWFFLLPPLFFVCVGSVELLIKTKFDTVLLISSSFQSKQKSSGNICSPSVFPMSNLDVFHIYKSGSPSSFKDWKIQKIYTCSPTGKPLRDAMFEVLSGCC